MSEVIHNHILSYKGKNYPIAPIKRVIAAGGSTTKEEVDEYGFRRNGFFFGRSDQWYPSDLIRQKEGGVIIGEGDIGKTWLVEALAEEDCDAVRVRTFPIRNYATNLRELVAEARMFWADTGDGCEYAILVLDGLDEVPDAWPIIAEICNCVSDGKKCRVWVTSRPCSGMKSLLNSGCIKDQYHLLPFSRDDVKELAEQVGEDGGVFLHALLERQVASFATKPGGATLLLKLYGEGKIDECSRIELTEQIAKDFSRDGRDGCRLCQNDEKFRDDDLLDASAWIAARIFFSQKDSIWLDTAVVCPNTAFPFADLPRGKYKDDILNAVTKRRLFEPLSVERLRVAYDTNLMPFLVAYWIKTHVPKEMIGKMLRTDKGVGMRLSAVMKYLCLYIPELGREWIAKNPCAFLDCPKAIELFGAPRFYELLEKQYLDLADFDYDTFINGHAEQLYGQKELNDVALKRLRDHSSTGRQAELAAIISRSAMIDIGETVDALVSYLEENWQTLDRRARHDLSYALFSIIDKCEGFDMRRLKALLKSLKVEGEIDEGPKGNLLRILWPKYLSAAELVEYLTDPVRENFGSSYIIFVSQTLPESLEVCVNRSNVLPLLCWATKHMRRAGEQSHCFDLASQIFTFAWQWATDKEIAAQLALCIAEYGIRDGMYCFGMPFSTEKFRTPPPWEVSELQCEKDFTKRAAVLDALLEVESMEDKNFEHLFAFGERYGLVCFSEFEEVFHLWSGYYADAGSKRKADRLAKTLETLSARSPRGKYTEERSLLLNAYPGVEQFDVAKLIRSDEHDALLSDKWKKDEELRACALEKAKIERLENLHTALATGKMCASSYLRFAHEITSGTNNGFDITKGCQWSQLTDCERDQIRDLAQRAATEFEHDKLDILGAIYFASALRLVWDDPVRTPKRLPAERWRAIANYILRASIDSSERAIYDEIINWGFQNFPDECAEGAFAAVVAELSDANPSAMALRNCEKWVTDEIIGRLIAQYNDDESRLIKILCVAIDVVKKYGRELPSTEQLFSSHIGDFKSIPKQWRTLLAMAVSFYPKTYVPNLIRLIDETPEALKSWVEFMAKDYRHEYLTDAFQHCGIADTARFYVWLRHEYPDSEAPVHDRCFSPGVKDEIYMMMPHLSSRLLDQPSEETIDVIDRDIAFNQGDFLIDMKKGVAKRLEAELLPELVSPDCLVKLSELERPIADLSQAEYKHLLKDMTKEFVTREELDVAKQGIMNWVLIKLHLKSKSDSGRKPTPREERLLNEAALVTCFRDAAFAMLTMPESGRRKLFKDMSKGKYIAQLTGIRAGSIGDIIDIKGNMARRKKTPADMPQFFFKICSDESVYGFFELVIKGYSKPCDKLSHAELYHLLKSHFERIREDEHRARENSRK